MEVAERKFEGILPLPSAPKTMSVDFAGTTRVIAMQVYSTARSDWKSRATAEAEK
jgi:hypothetical protein